MVCFQEKEGRSENGGHRFISNAADCNDRTQERFIYFFRVRTERKNISGSKGPREFTKFRVLMYW